MIASFMMVSVVLAAEYGSLPTIGPKDCPYLQTVEANSSSILAVPLPCAGSGCVAAGCIEAVRPEFYAFPDRSTLCNIIFFLLNMLAAPLQPHMVQRAYIASSDASLRIVMAAMLLAPFLAQPPGIVMGLTTLGRRALSLLEPLMTSGRVPTTLHGPWWIRRLQPSLASRRS